MEVYKSMTPYFSQVLHEFKYIRWLTVSRAVLLTAVVVAVGLAAGFILGAIDNGFASLLRSVVV